jgi:hypothetical protein
MSSNKVVRLNIGGEIYHALKDTLLKSAYFVSLLGGKFANVLDNTGAIYINREGEYFYYILYWLREQTLPEKTYNCNDFDVFYKIIEEAQFYLCDTLTLYVHTIMKKTKQSQIINLNIGGIHHYVEYSLLTYNVYGGFFQNLRDFYDRKERGEDGSWSPYYDKDKNIFVNRNGKLFEHVLYYLRTGDVPDIGTEELLQLNNEAKFYLGDSNRLCEKIKDYFNRRLTHYNV